jgi:hypothetical protein
LKLKSPPLYTTRVVASELTDAIKLCGGAESEMRKSAGTKLIVFTRLAYVP